MNSSPNTAFLAISAAATTVAVGVSSYIQNHQYRNKHSAGSISFSFDASSGHIADRNDKIEKVQLITCQQPR